MGVPAIQCNHVTFRYFEAAKRPILDDVSLSIPSGEITVLMGSSGCGKSTLAAVLCGLLPENGGFLQADDITLFGQPLASYTPQQRAERISMMFQNPDLQFCMQTPRQELYFCLENLLCPPEDMPARAEASAAWVGVTHLLDQPIHTLSGGEKQLCVLACIHLLDAKCIVLDEPFSNLDPDSVRTLITVLGKLCREQGKTIVAIDHMSDHWMNIADRFVLLGEGGRPLCTVTSREEMAAYKTLFREQGVAYPGVWQDSAIKPEPLPATHSCITLTGVTLPIVPPKNRRWRRRSSAPVTRQDSLLYQTDAQFQSGAITAILGPSGCGKTSLLLTLLGQRPYDGSIRLTGDTDKPMELRDIRSAELFGRVGCAFQNPENQFVTQNVAEELSAGQQNAPVDALLDSAGLKKYRNFSPYMLSQGQQRRLAVLAVLSGGQQLLLLDEPTYGQDYRSARALMELVRARVRACGLTVLMTTHDRRLAQAYAQCVYTVRDRRLVKEATL